MICAGAMIIALLTASCLTISLSRSRGLRDVAGACLVIVLPAITVATLVCGLLYRVISP